MKFTPLRIPEVILIQPRVFGDSRGFFYESYNYETFVTGGIRDVFVQDNISRSAKGVLRGLHYQMPPQAQAKLVRVQRGSILDVVVDIRKNSPTFGTFVAGVMEAESKELLYVPVGFAHGFCALEEGTEIQYKVSATYSPAHERGVLWNDPSLGIDWPNLEFIISDKDKIHPLLRDALLFDLP